MKRQLKRFAAGLLLAAMVAVFAPYQMMEALAANAKLTFSDPTVTVGNEVSVTMRITSTSGDALGGSDVTLSYDPSILEFVSGTNASGGAGSVRVLGSMQSTDTQSFSFTLKFKALQAGTAVISVTTQEIYDINTQTVTLDHQGTSTVKVNPLATYSKDAALKTLKVSPGTLTPEFSADVESYSLDVGGDVDKIAVSAEPNDANAKVVITGHSDLQVGDNTVTCKVTAEDGQTVKNYTILVHKSEETSEGGESEGAETTTDGSRISSAGVELTLLALTNTEEIPDGYEAGTVTIDGQAVECYVPGGEASPEYCLFYGETGSGESGFYRYDLTEKTLQRYFADGNAAAGSYEELVANYNSLVEDYDARFLIIIALIAVSAVLVIVIIVLVVKKGGGRGHGGDDDDDEEDDDYEPVRQSREAAAQNRKVSSGKAEAVRGREERYLRGEEFYEGQDEEDGYEDEMFEEEPFAEDETEELRGGEPEGRADEDEDDFEFVDLDE